VDHPVVVDVVLEGGPADAHAVAQAVLRFGESLVAVLPFGDVERGDHGLGVELGHVADRVGVVVIAQELHARQRLSRLHASGVQHHVVRRDVLLVDRDDAGDGA